MTDDSNQLLESLRDECVSLRERLEEAERTLSALRSGDLTAVSINADSVDEMSTSHEVTLKLTEQPELASMDQSLALSRARLAALNLMESAISARARAEDISHELQREIDNRLETEAALVDTERRYRRIVEAIGDVYWLSTADWQTILYFDPSESPVKTGQRPGRSSH